MQRLLRFISIFLVVLMAVMARAGDSPEITAAARTPSPATATSSAADAELSALELQVGELHDLLSDQARQIQVQAEQLHRQQQLMEHLEQRLLALGARPQAIVTDEAPSAQPSTPAASRSLAPVAYPLAASLPQDVQSQSAPQDDIARRIEERIARIGPFTFSGDFRLRDDRFMGGPANESLVRNRLRIRARLNLNTRLNDDVSGGLTLASGHIEDAISNNQDLDQFFTRKPILIDRAFLTYTPHQFQPLSVTGGKFAYTWYRTELTWDNDVNVEGASSTLNFAFEKNSVLKRVALVSFALPFAQTTGINFNFRPGDTDRSVRQSVVYGGQLQSEWQLTQSLQLSAYTGFYNWHNADPIALSVEVANPASPNGGTLRLSVSGLQNSITTWTQTTTVPTVAGGIATVNTSVVNAQFASQFGLFDNIARFDIKTKSPRWPAIVIADFVQNTKACANIGHFLAPAPAPGATITASTNAPCNPRDRQAYWLEGRFGRIAEQHDWQFAYTRMFIEREAVLGAYNFSEMRQNSNVSQHRIEALYNAYRNVQLGFNGFFGRPLGTPPPGETLLKRLQFDVLYRF